MPSPAKQGEPAALTAAIYAPPHTLAQHNLPQHRAGTHLTCSRNPTFPPTTAVCIDNVAQLGCQAQRVPVHPLQQAATHAKAHRLQHEGGVGRYGMRRLGGRLEGGAVC